MDTNFIQSEEFDIYNKIGEDIIGCAFEIRRKVGRGLREKYYEAALAYELTKRGHKVERQVELPAVYCGVVIDDSYYADIIVDDKVIVEVKAIMTMKEAECRQLLTYLKVSNYKLGYLINFGARDFRTGKFNDMLPYRHGIYRFVNRL